MALSSEKLEGGDVAAIGKFFDDASEAERSALAPQFDMWRSGDSAYRGACWKT